ncbi:MAG: cyclase, partial [Acidobacteria bacterium]|nr:cyclase [Acidobacteriota bacterium]
TGDPLTFARTCIVLGQVLTSRVDTAIALAGGVVDAAEATGNPCMLSFALLNFGMALRVADPATAMNTLRRGMAEARGSRNRLWEASCATQLAGLEAHHGDLRASLDLYFQAISVYHDAGDTAAAKGTLGGLAVCLDLISRYEPAAIVAGYATSPLTGTVIPDLASVVDHLVGMLGADRHTSLTTTGLAMSAAEAVRFAFDQIELARGEL